MGIFEKKPDGGKSSARDRRTENGNGKRKSNRKEPKHRPLLEDRRHRAYFIFALLYVATVVIMASGYLSRSQTVAEGNPSPYTIVSQSRVSYESAVLTEEYRREAVAAVSPVMSVDQQAIRSIEENNASLYDGIREIRQRVRDGESLSGSTPEGDQESAFRFFGLGEGEISYLLSAPDGDIDMLEEYSAGLLRKYMSSGVQTSGLEIVRQNMLEEIISGGLSTPAKSVVAAVIRELPLVETLLYDDEATQRRREEISRSVDPVMVTIEAGEVLVQEGEVVTPVLYEKLQNAKTTLRDYSHLGILGIALTVLVLYLLMGWFLLHYRPELPGDESYLVLLAVLMILGVILTQITAGVAAISALGGAFFFIAPLAAVGMLAAILLDNEIAIMMSMILGILLGLTADLAMEYALVAMVTTFVGVFSVSRVHHRSDLMKSALYIAGVGLAGILALGFFSGYSPTELFWAGLLGILGGFLSSILTIGILPYFELIFKVTTSLKLLELSDPNQPVLKQLLLEAPGTYHHSIVVSNLAEAAAEAVGANSLLARVGAYYHDIGKIRRPYFFIENQQMLMDNPHEKLSPRLSTLIITSHVKDGLEMARENRLPRSVQQFISTHHGDSMVSFFYAKAREAEGDSVKESEFRYDGPKPVSREAAIVMLADTVEASVRSLKNPNPGRIEGFVRKVIRDKFEAGQLSESQLTFRELETIARAFVRVISGIYHQRVEYPEKLAAEMERSKGNNGTSNDEPAESGEPAAGTGDNPEPDPGVDS